MKATQKTVTVRNEIGNSWRSLRAGGSDGVVGMGRKGAVGRGGGNSVFIIDSITH